MTIKIMAIIKNADIKSNKYKDLNNRNNSK